MTERVKKKPTRHTELSVNHVRINHRAVDGNTTVIQLIFPLPVQFGMVIVGVVTNIPPSSLRLCLRLSLRLCQRLNRHPCQLMSRPLCLVPNLPRSPRRRLRRRQQRSLRRSLLQSPPLGRVIVGAGMNIPPKPPPPVQCGRVIVGVVMITPAPTSLPKITEIPVWKA